MAAESITGTVAIAFRGIAKKKAGSKIAIMPIIANVFW